MTPVIRLRTQGGANVEDEVQKWLSAWRRSEGSIAKRHVNCNLDGNDCEVRLSARYSSSAMAVEDILWDARPLLALPIPRVDFRRCEADV
jgi:hypothetical protein